MSRHAPTRAQLRSRFAEFFAVCHGSVSRAHGHPEHSHGQHGRGTQGKIPEVTLGIVVILTLLGLLCPLGGCTRQATKPPAPVPANTPIAPPATPATPPRAPPRDAPQAAPPRAQPPPAAWIEIQPGVRINLSERLVEFDAAVAVDCHQPETPDVYLEVVCCTPDTREHEALVVTRAQPSTIHAALLAVGATPGAPASWRAADGNAVPQPPRGTPVRVTFLLDTPGGGRHEIDPATWVVQKDTQRTLRETAPDTGWVFAGSRIRRFRGQDVYDADGTGQLIGLHTFGSETLAWTRVESPDATLQEPLWLANNARMPPIGTPVTVRLAVLDGPPEPSPPTHSVPTLSD